VRERVISLRRAEVGRCSGEVSPGDLRADTDAEIAHELLIGPAYYHCCSEASSSTSSRGAHRRCVPARRRRD